LFYTEKENLQGMILILWLFNCIWFYFLAFYVNCFKVFQFWWRFNQMGEVILQRYWVLCCYKWPSFRMV